MGLCPAAACRALHTPVTGHCVLDYQPQSTGKCTAASSGRDGHSCHHLATSRGKVFNTPSAALRRADRASIQGKEHHVGKRLSEAPLTDLGPADFMSGPMPSCIATEAQRVGPLFRWPTRFGPDSGREIVFLVGPEANRLVFHTRREAFSHDLGWTPIIGDLMGAGLLNQDGAVWARSRKMWNPAFTNAYM